MSGEMRFILSWTCLSLVIPTALTPHWQEAEGSYKPAGIKESVFQLYSHPVWVGDTHSYSFNPHVRWYAPSGQWIVGLLNQACRNKYQYNSLLKNIMYVEQFIAK